MSGMAEATIRMLGHPKKAQNMEYTKYFQAMKTLE
jgi:hypothetical protein